METARGPGIAAVLFAAFVWGTTGTAATFAPDVGPAAIGAAAMGIGGLLQALLALRGILGSGPQLWRQRALLAAGGVAVAIYPIAFYGSMRMAGVTIGTVITIGSAPLLSAAIEYLLDGARLGRRWLAGTALGLAGMALICLAEGGTAGAQVPMGVALGLLGGFTYALYSWTARRMMMGGTRPTVAMGATFGLGGLLLLPVLLAVGAPFLESATNLAVGAYMALVPMFLGYVAFGYGLGRVPASMATTITLFEPVVAAILAVLVVGERLPPAGWVGVAMVIGCLATIALPVSDQMRQDPKRCRP